jgi:phosphatidylinositol dimannoside acyltransferase
MNLKDLVSTPRFVRLSLFFSQHVPERLGHRLAWWAAGLVCRLKPAVHRIVQANLGQVLGPEAGDRRVLDRTVRQVFYTAIRGYYDLFRAWRLPQEQLVASVEIPEAARAVVRSLWNREGGSVLVIPHLSSFDLGGQAMAFYLPETQVISLPDPPPGFLLTNELRRRAGIEVTPLGPAALRQAIKLLRRGGVVSVGGDRPVSDLDEPVPFFGRPARVPSGHVRLALKTGAIVVIACCVFSPLTQKYTIHVEPPLEMIRTGNRDEEVRVNMRRVLDALERVIHCWPEQWQMLVPVWPELVEA